MFNRFFHFINTFRKRISKDNISALSSQLTYYLLLSFFPFVMFLLTILSYTPITERQFVSRISNLFPEDISKIITSILNEISKNQSNALLSITVIITIWSASRGVLAIIKGLNIAYRINETRSFIYIRAISVLYTLIFAIIIVLTFIMLIFGNKLLALITNLFNIPSELMGLIQFVRYVGSIGLLFLFFIIIYNAIPNRKISFTEVIPGSIFASIGWVLLSIFFSIYIDNFGEYSYMYGSLTGLILLLLWLYISSNIILIGGELNAFLVEQKKTND
ncbi:MAG: YihY/virulence factor BrkB family protein [Eubacteriales bacterium]